MEVPQKVKNGAIIRFRNSISVYFFPKEIKTLLRKRDMQTYVHCTIIYNSQDKQSKWEQIDVWIKM